MNPDNQSKIRTHLMNLLSRREHTEDELLRKLTAKGFPAEEIQKTLREFTDQDLLSHDRFIENYIHSRQSKGYGPLRIKAELLERGLKEEFIEEHLNIADNAWFIVAQSVWQKRFKGVQPKNFNDKAQQMRFLHYRGFSPEQIESIYD